MLTPTQVTTLSCHPLNSTQHGTFEKLTVAHLIKKLLAIYATRMFISVISGFHSAFLKSINFIGRLMLSIV